MKKLIPFLMLATTACAQTLTNSVEFNLTDWLQSAYVNRPVTIQGLSTPRTNPPYIAVNFLLNTNSGSTGAFTLTNILDGTYRVTIAGAATPTTFSIYVPTNQGAAHHASSLLTTSIVDNAVTAYTKSQANALFVSRAGTNASLRTNGGLVYVDVTGGGSGSVTGSYAFNAVYPVTNNVSGTTVVHGIAANYSNNIVLAASNAAVTVAAAADLASSNVLASRITTTSNAITNAVVLQGANATVTDGVTNGVRFFVVNGPSGGASDTNELRVINVKTDFGAVGDGVADDTAAISNALTFAGADNPITETSMRTATNRTRNAVFLPAGTYNISSPLVLSNDHLNLFGAGRGRTIIKAVGNISGITTFRAPRYVTLRDFSIVSSNSIPVTGTVGIDINGDEESWFGGASYYIGFWNIDGVDVNYFDIGIKGTIFQDSKIYANMYHNNVGLLLTNACHGVYFEGSSRFNNHVNHRLSNLRGCRIWAKDSDLSTAETATNVFHFTGSILHTTIMGRSEIHRTNVIPFHFENGTINRLTLDHYDLGAFSTQDGWSLYFGDAYTNNQAFVRLEGGILEVTNRFYSGAQVRMPHGSNVKLFSTLAQSPIVAAFTNGTYYTNFRAGAEIEFTDSGRRAFPNTTGNQSLAHQPWFNYRGTNTEQYFVSMYDRGGGLTNVNLSEPWFQIRDNEVVTPDDSVLWSGASHSFSGIITNRLNLNVTNTGSAGIQGMLRITSEGVGGTAGHQIVMADNSANNSAKVARFGAVNWHPSLNPLTVFVANHSSSSNTAVLSIGGATSLGTPFRELEFYGGTSSANGTGNLLMKQYIDGGLGIGSAATAPTDPGDGNLGVVGTITIGTAGTATNHAARLVDVTNIVTDLRRETLFLYASGTTNATTTGTNLVIIVPYNCTIVTNNVTAAVNRHFAPTGSQMRFRLQTNGVSIMSTDLHIDATETSSLTAETNFVFSTTNLIRGSFLELNVIQVGSTLPGRGAHVALPIRETP
jgi:hypothetical protein